MKQYYKPEVLSFPSTKYDPSPYLKEGPYYTGSFYVKKGIPSNEMGMVHISIQCYEDGNIARVRMGAGSRRTGVHVEYTPGYKHTWTQTIKRLMGKGGIYKS